jgi:hypothetical protein
VSGPGRLDLRSIFSDNELVYLNLARFEPRFHLESVFQQRLQHELILISRDRPATAVGFRLDVVAIRIDPVRSSDNLELVRHVATDRLIRGFQKRPERYACHVETVASRASTSLPVSWRAGFDRNSAIPQPGTSLSRYSYRSPEATIRIFSKRCSKLRYRRLWSADWDPRPLDSFYQR